MKIKPLILVFTLILCIYGVICKVLKIKSKKGEIEQDA